MPTEPPVFCSNQSDARAAEKHLKLQRQGLGGESSENDPKAKPPKQVASGSGAFFLTPGPAKPKPKRP